MSSPAKLTLNDKITNLNAQIQWFYSDDFSLDLAEKNYKAALSLAKEIETDLSSLKNRITVLSHDFTA
ncbi:hypothetical protein IJI17_00360 [Candidatus Saccharibacteria bacterium]|nr:hypothetical protein [Candidatus Saccharibacteria bacterium]